MPNQGSKNPRVYSGSIKRNVNEAEIGFASGVKIIQKKTRNEVELIEKPILILNGLALVKLLKNGVRSILRMIVNTPKPTPKSVVRRLESVELLKREQAAVLLLTSLSRLVRNVCVVVEMKRNSAAQD